MMGSIGPFVVMSLGFPAKATCQESDRHLHQNDKGNQRDDDAERQQHKGQQEFGHQHGTYQERSQNEAVEIPESKAGPALPRSRLGLDHLATMSVESVRLSVNAIANSWLQLPTPVIN